MKWHGGLGVAFLYGKRPHSLPLNLSTSRRHASAAWKKPPRRWLLLALWLQVVSISRVAN
jgi:hypothetical protein